MQDGPKLTTDEAARVTQKVATVINNIVDACDMDPFWVEIWRVGLNLEQKEKGWRERDNIGRWWSEAIQFCRQHEANENKSKRVLDNVYLKEIYIPFKQTVGFYTFFLMAAIKTFFDENSLAK